MTLPRSSSQQNSANPCRRWQVAGTEVPLPLHLRLGPQWIAAGMARIRSAT